MSDSTSPRAYEPHVVVQVTRGLAPARAIVGATSAAIGLGMHYELVEGMCAIAAKNRAVEIADARGSALLFVEDDALLVLEDWASMIAAPDIAVVQSWMRDGNSNVTKRRDGSVAYAGTVVLKVSRAVLDALPRPVFVSGQYGWDAVIEEIHQIVERPAVSRGGDVSFFWQVQRHIVPRPDVLMVGPCVDAWHDLNKVHDLDRPTPVRYAYRGEPIDIHTWQAPTTGSETDYCVTSR